MSGKALTLTCASCKFHAEQLAHHRCTGLDHRSQPVPVRQLRDCSWPDMRHMVSQRAWKDRAPKKCKEIPTPLFMDVHETLPEGATVKDVMGAHKADLETQDEYGVKYLRYWVDEKNAKVFCLAEAPNAEAAIAVHREAHGLLADRIYEVVEGS